MSRQKQTKEIEIAKSTELAPARRSTLEIVANAASDPNVDAAKMSVLVDVQLRIMKVEAEAAFNLAYSEMERNFPRITKTGKASYQSKSGGQVNYSHVEYDKLDKELRPMLREHGFSISFDTEELPNKTIYLGFLTHRQGHVRTARLALPADNSGGKNPIQGVGSTNSYARRYLTMMLLNIVAEDEDTDGIVLLTPEQVRAIEILITQSKADRTRFLGYMGVPDVKEIQQGDYVKATQRLADKLNAKPK